MTIDRATKLALELQEKNVEIIFAITGAGNLALIDAITKNTSIQIIYSHHEQSAVIEAQGYARTSGKPGVAIVTTGGGTINALTGILSAYLDSIPILVISGNESSFHIENMKNFRAYGVQGFDSTKTSENICKLSIRVGSEDDLSKVLESAWLEMNQDRKGPVHIDFPMDLQRTKILESSSETGLEKSRSLIENLSDVQDFDKLIKLLEVSVKPLFIIGNGVREDQSLKNLKSFINRLKIPFTLSWSALDLFPSAHELNFGRIGIYGNRYSNIILQKSDLVICLGTRLAIPQVGYDKNDFGRNATKIVVDIDEVELSKFPENWIKINSDVRDVIYQLNSKFLDSSPKPEINDWVNEIKDIKSSLPDFLQIGQEVSDKKNFVHSYDVINYLNQISDSNYVYATDVGAGLLTGHFAIQIKEGQRFFSSQGLGEMGFGLPAAIGAYFSDKSKKIICLNTDGGIMFNLQELQLISEHQIPIKLFIFNNEGYSMIKISQQNLFAGNLSGSTKSTGISFPRFEDVAKTFKLNYRNISNLESLDESLTQLINDDSPYLFEIIMDPNQKYLPRLSTTKLDSGELISPPLEDLDPLLDIDTLRNLLGYEPHKNSFRARGLI